MTPKVGHYYRVMDILVAYDARASSELRFEDVATAKVLHPGYVIRCDRILSDERIVFDDDYHLHLFAWDMYLKELHPLEALAQVAA